MTWEQLLNECPNGLPSVIDADGVKGEVTVIKNTEGYRGCAVRFVNKNYDTWFYAQPGNDGRKRYMQELSILK